MEQLHQKNSVKNGTAPRLRIWHAVPWLWLAAGYLFSLWYQLVPGRLLVDDDMAGEMVLANLLNQDGGILSHNWYYTTELRVFETQWFYRLGLLLFPHDWHLARVVGMAILLALVVAAWLFFCRGAGFARAGVWCAAALMWPFGYWYFFLCLYGGYYFIYILFSLVSLGLVLRLANPCSRKKALAYGLALALLGLGSGLNGVRQLMVFYLPLLAAAGLLLAVAIHRAGPFPLKELPARCAVPCRMAGAALLGTVFAGLGYLYNLLVLVHRYSYASYDSMTWVETFTLPTLLNAWADYLCLFGYHGGVALFSMQGIASGLGLMLGGAVLFSLVRLWQRRNALSDRYRLVYYFTLAGLVICDLVFAFLQVYGANYWLPLLPFAFALLQMEAETEHFRLPCTRRVLALGLVLAVTACSLGTIRGELAHPLRGKQDLHRVADWLVENDYTEGYAAFWNSQNLTEMTSGQLEMWTVESMGGLKIHTWLQPTSHRNALPAGRCFAIFDLKEDGRPEESAYMQVGGGTIVYEDDWFAVVGYDSGDALAAAMQAAGLADEPA